MLHSAGDVQHHKSAPRRRQQSPPQLSDPSTVGPIGDRGDQIGEHPPGAWIQGPGRLSANTAVTCADNPVDSATSGNNPRRATRRHRRPRTLSPHKPLGYSSPRKCLPTQIIDRELSHYPLQDRHFH